MTHAPRDDGDTALVAKAREAYDCCINTGGREEIDPTLVEDLADRLEALTRSTAPSDEAAFEAVARQVSAHLNPVNIPPLGNLTFEQQEEVRREAFSVTMAALEEGRASTTGMMFEGRSDFYHVTDAGCALLGTTRKEAER